MCDRFTFTAYGIALHFVHHAHARFSREVVDFQVMVRNWMNKNDNKIINTSNDMAEGYLGLITPKFIEKIKSQKHPKYHFIIR